MSSDPFDGQFVPFVTRNGQPAARPRYDQGWRKHLGLALAVVVMAAAFIALRSVLAHVSWSDVSAALGSLSFFQVLASLLLVAASYWALTGYDYVALRYLRKDVPYPTIALGSFISFAFANTMGFVFLTAGSVRYRIFGPYDVSPAEVAVLTVVCGITFTLAALAVVGGCLLIAPSVISTLFGLPVNLSMLLGAAILLGLAGYIWWVGSDDRAISRSGWELELPGARSTLAQIAVGALDMVFAAAALYLLLPADPGIGFLVFVGVFASAITLGLISSVPGGLGVFETVVLFALPHMPSDQLLASLLVYRVLYYLLPFLVALVLFIWREANRMPLLSRSSRLAALWRMLRRRFAMAEADF